MKPVKWCCYVNLKMGVKTAVLPQDHGEKEGALLAQIEEIRKHVPWSLLHMTFVTLEESAYLLQLPSSKNGQNLEETMPRPTSKIDLLAAIEKERGALETYLGTLKAEQMVESGVVGEWSVKDVLAHLITWEQMCLGWYKAGLRGEKPALPAPGFKWNQTPQLNQHIYETNRERPLSDIQAQFHTSHAEILECIKALPNDALFTAGRYAWTNKNTLGTYMVSATSSHYLWARKEIRKGFKRKASV